MILKSRTRDTDKAQTDTDNVIRSRGGGNSVLSEMSWTACDVSSVNCYSQENSSRKGSVEKNFTQCLRWKFFIAHKVAHGSRPETEKSARTAATTHTARLLFHERKKDWIDSALIPKGIRFPVCTTGRYNPRRPRSGFNCIIQSNLSQKTIHL